jgi:hypothetical protein
MPLCAIIDGTEVISIDVPESEWKTLKKRRKKGELSVTIVGCDHHGHLVTKGGMQFFRHDPNTLTKNCENESIEHIRLKIKIINYCRSLGWEAKPEVNEFGGLWRPDVLTWNQEKKIAFEVQLSSIPLEILKERDKIRKESHIDTYWILPKFPFGTNEYTGDVSSIPDFKEPGFYEEIGFFIADNIQTKKFSSEIDLIKWVSLVLTGEYKGILTEGVEKFKIHQSELKRKKDLQDQFENLQKQIYYYNYDIQRKIPSRIEKIKEQPELDDKINSINHAWDAFENLVRNVKRLKSKIYNRLIYIDISEVDDIYKTFDSAKEDLQAFKKHTQDYEKILQDEHDFHKLNFKRRQNLVSDEDGNTPNNIPDNNSNKKSEIIQYVTFECALHLESNWITHSNGMRYQVVPGLNSQLPIDVAKEFEQNGYGKVIGGS